MLFTSSASFVSPCPLLHYVCRHTPFYAVDFLFSGWDFYSFGLFWFFPHQHVYKHIAHDLLGYLEMASGRMAKEKGDRYMPAFFEEKEIPALCRSISVICHCF